MMELKTIQIIPENLSIIDDFDFDFESSEETFKAISEAINAQENVKKESNIQVKNT